jgi:predicted Zn-dependent peptidase
LYGLDPHEPFSFANNIMNIKKDDVHSVIDKYLKDANFVSVSVDPN